MTPPLFLFAKLCFIGAALILWAKMLHWLTVSKGTRAERMILAFLIFGVSGMVLVETVRWITKNQPGGNSAPANRSLIYARFLGGYKNPLGSARKIFKVYDPVVLSEIEFEAHIAVRYGDSRPRVEVYAKGINGAPAIYYAIEHYSEIRDALVKESGFQILETTESFTIYPDYIITREQIGNMISKASGKKLMLRVDWLQENGKLDGDPNPYAP